MQTLGKAGPVAGSCSRSPGPVSGALAPAPAPAPAPTPWAPPPLPPPCPRAYWFVWLLTPLTLWPSPGWDTLLLFLFLGFIVVLQDPYPPPIKLCSPAEALARAHGKSRDPPIPRALSWRVGTRKARGGAGEPVSHQGLWGCPWPGRFGNRCPE